MGPLAHRTPDPFTAMSERATTGPAAHRATGQGRARSRLVDDVVAAEGALVGAVGREIGERERCRRVGDQARVLGDRRDRSGEFGDRRLKPSTDDEATATSMFGSSSPASASATSHAAPTSSIWSASRPAASIASTARAARRAIGPVNSTVSAFRSDSSSRGSRTPSWPTAATTTGAAATSALAAPIGSEADDARASAWNEPANSLHARQNPSSLSSPGTPESGITATVEDAPFVPPVVLGHVRGDRHIRRRHRRSRRLVDGGRGRVGGGGQLTIAATRTARQRRHQAGDNDREHDHRIDVREHRDSLHVELSCSAS